MPNVQLFQTWIHNGKFYGPGEAELSDDVYDALKAKHAFEEPPPPELPNRSMLSAESSGGAGVELAPELLEKLAAGGFDSGEAIAIATDSELLAVKGIGRASLRDIRTVYGGGNADSE
jgi:hypothetical protein